MMSTARLIKAMSTQQRIMDPVTIGVSRLLIESTTSLPIPGQPNTVSAKAEPVMTKENCIPMAVTIGKIGRASCRERVSEIV